MSRLGDSVAMLETIGDRHGTVVVAFNPVDPEPWLVLVGGEAKNSSLVIGRGAFFTEAVQQAYDMSAALVGHERPGAGNAVQP